MARHGRSAPILAPVSRAPGDTTPPTVNVTSAGSSTISRIAGFDAYAYAFQVNEAGQAWEIRLGATVLESGGAFAANATLSGTITDDELIAAGGTEGPNTLSFRAQDTAGNWSP